MNLHLPKALVPIAAAHTPAPARERGPRGEDGWKPVPGRESLTRGCQHLLLIAFLGLLSYWPLLQEYVWAIDDYPLSQTIREGGLGYLEKAFQDRGVWRLLQHGLVGLILSSVPWLPGLLAVGSHILTCQLFYLVCRRLSGRWDDALLLALIAVCSPFGFQALAWTSAWPYVLHSLILWGSLWMFLHLRSGPSWGWLAWGLIFSASLLVHDHLLFALAFVAGAAWLLSPQPESWRIWLRPSVRWLPLLLAGGYLAAYVLCKPTDHRLYMEPHVHWPSLLSPLANLWQWEDAWTPLFCPDLWQVAASEWPLGRLGLGLCMLGGIGALWFVPSTPDRGETIGGRFAVRVMLTMFILFLLTSLIYVPAGGYSFDSRKKYPLFLFLLAGGGIAVSAWGRGIVLLSQQWRRKAAATLLLAALMPACWLHTGLWRAEARATRLLSDFLAGNPAYHEVSVSKKVDPLKISPGLGRLYGQSWIHTFYVGQPFVMDHPGQPQPVIKEIPDADTPSLVYDFRNREWRESNVAGVQ